MSALRIGVDFDGNGWVDLLREPTDRANLLGANAANAWDLQRSVASGAITASQALTAMGPWNQPMYGRSGILLTLVDTNDRYAIGFDGGTTYDITGQASGTYSACVWARTTGGTPTVRLRLKSSGTAGSVFGTAVGLNDSTWTRLEVSGTMPFSNQSLFFEVDCTSGSSAGIYLYGPMMVSGATLPETLNCGADSQYENITRYVMSARWQTGFVRPYQNVAGAGLATFLLRNETARFSPENSAGPLYGLFQNDRLVQVIRGSDVLWTGFVEAWNPMAGTTSPRRCTLRATDGHKFIQDTEVFPDLKASQDPATLINHIIDKVESAAAKVLTFDGVKASGDNFNTPYSIDLTTLDAETVPYYFDQQPDDGQAPMFLLKDILNGVQGKFWMTRYGFIDYAGPAEDGGAVAATFQDGDLLSIDYQYGQGIINECTVRYYPREAPIVNVNLYDLGEPLEVAPGETESFRAYYRLKETDERVGAVASSVVLANLSYDGGGLVASIVDVDAQSCQIDVVSSSGSTRSLLTLRVRGDALRAWDPGSRTRSDATSIGDYGRRGEQINSTWTSKGQWAKRIAQFRVNRFKDPRGEVLSITTKVAKAEQVLTCWIGRKVRVVDAHLSHDANYIVIGEDHDWTKGDNHDVRLFLERATTAKVSTTSF